MSPITPSAQEPGSFRVFCELDKTALGYRRNLDHARANDELIDVSIGCPTFARMELMRQKLVETFGQDKRYVIGTAVTGRQESLEASLHMLFPSCPAWATEEERAWFQERFKELQHARAVEDSTLGSGQS